MLVPQTKIYFFSSLLELALATTLGSKAKDAPTLKALANLRAILANAFSVEIPVVWCRPRVVAGSNPGLAFVNAFGVKNRNTFGVKDQEHDS